MQPENPPAATMQRLAREVPVPVPVPVPMPAPMHALVSVPVPVHAPVHSRGRATERSPVPSLTVIIRMKEDQVGLHA